MSANFCLPFLPFYCFSFSLSLLALFNSVYGSDISLHYSPPPPTLRRNTVSLNMRKQFAAITLVMNDVTGGLPKRLDGGGVSDCPAVLLQIVALRPLVSLAHFPQFDRFVYGRKRRIKPVYRPKYHFHFSSPSK